MAVKVLLSEEDKFLDSCYKEAVSWRPCRACGARPTCDPRPMWSLHPIRRRRLQVFTFACDPDELPLAESAEMRYYHCAAAAQVLSRVLAHPNILQTYDFQTAVLCHEDVARAGVAWERMQSPHWHQQKQQPGCGGRSGCGAPEEGVCPQLHGMDGRMDSFELLPCGSSANGGHAPGG